MITLVNIAQTYYQSTVISVLLALVFALKGLPCSP